MNVHAVKSCSIVGRSQLSRRAMRIMARDTLTSLAPMDVSAVNKDMGKGKGKKEKAPASNPDT